MSDGASETTSSQLPQDDTKPEPAPSARVSAEKKEEPPPAPAKSEPEKKAEPKITLTRRTYGERAREFFFAKRS